MVLRYWWPGIIGLFCCFTLLSMDFDYTITEQGEWSIKHIENVKDPDWVGPILSCVGSITLTALTLAAPALLCHFYPDDSIPCKLGGGVTGFIGGLGSIGSWSGSIYWARTVINKLVPLTKRRHFARLLRRAYIAVNTENQDEKEQVLRYIEKFMRAQDSKYEITYAAIPDPIQTFAQKLVLLNEAGHFSRWSALFPEDVDVGLGEYHNSVRRPKINFPKQKWTDNDPNEIILIDIRRFLDEDDESFNREQLYDDIEELRGLKIEFDKARSACEKKAQQYLLTIQEIQNLKSDMPPTEILLDD